MSYSISCSVRVFVVGVTPWEIEKSMFRVIFLPYLFITFLPLEVGHVSLSDFPAFPESRMS